MPFHEESLPLHTHRPHCTHLCPRRVNSAQTKVSQGRWFFLVVVVLQFISVLVGLVLRFCVFPRQQEYYADDFAEGGFNHQSTVAQVQMENLKASVAGRSTGATNPEASQSFYAGSRKINKSVSKKMTAKYGDYAHDADFKKSWWSRMFG